MNYRLIQTKRGYCGILFENELVHRILQPDSNQNLMRRIESDFAFAKASKTGLQEVASFLVDFHAGKDVTLSMEHVDVSRCTPFQLSVLNAERRIPRGMTASYSWVASKVGTKAFRAVGNALATNPFPFVVPCHRSVRNDGSIGKYQGGPEMKRSLLEMEGVVFGDNGRVRTECILR
ncbi:MAG: methylated-DNA--[protein]-cysteine S-methyltransferase [Candidatus Thorarchaeota archaeon]